METLGPYLKQTRRRLRLTLREVQGKTGISNAYLSQLENGKIKQPSPSVLHKLATCYNESYDHFLSLSGYPLPSGLESEKPRPSFRFGAAWNDLTEEEEGKLREYLEFLRSRKGR